MTLQLPTLAARQLAENSSDLHLVAGAVPLLRLANGMLAPIPEAEPVTAADVLAAVDEWAGEAAGQKFRATKVLETGIELPEQGRFRLTGFYEQNGPVLVLRRIPAIIPAPSELDLPPSVLSSLEHLHGLILITGTNGSGKTTTMASLIQHLNLTQRINIITLEDPIEYRFTSDKAIVSQCELGTHFETFAEATCRMMRRDTNVVAIGELRDRETVAAALALAESGPLVIGTLHTRDAAQTVQRLIDFFPASDQDEIAAQLAITLNTVLSQKLVRTADGLARVCVRERMFVNDAIRYSIRERNLSEIYSAIQTGGSEDMLLFDDELLRLVLAGRITAHQALQEAHDWRQLRAALEERSLA